MIEVRQYAFGATEYAAALQLRKALLREPLGLTYAPADLAREVDDVHIGAFEADELVGTLILTPQGNTAKMRQVAVRGDRQRAGIGRRLVEFSEAVARDMGCRRITLHARISVIDFYLALGYACTGEQFEEVTVPHRAMSKSLH